MTAAVPNASRAAEELVALASGFAFESREVDPRARARIEAAVQTLAAESSRPRIRDTFHLLNGAWLCLFTDSRHVLGLNAIPLVRLTRVRQRVVIEHGQAEGISYNIGELTRGGSVKLVCGELARLRPSAEADDRIDLEYQHFYFAPRLLTPYEGPWALSQGLVAGSLHGSFRLPFRKPGWQRHVYLDDRLRVLYGNSGGLFVMIRDDP